MSIDHVLSHNITTPTLHNNQLLTSKLLLPLSEETAFDSLNLDLTHPSKEVLQCHAVWIVFDVGLNTGHDHRCKETLIIVLTAPASLGANKTADTKINFNSLFSYPADRELISSRLQFHI